MKILTILGARPQFVKAAALSREFSKRPEIKEVIVHTGQHFDHKMSDIFFEEMSIPKPNYFLDINGVSHGAMTGRMLEAIEQVILSEKPDCVLVYGDTNSTLAGALAAVKLHVPVAHVEAGLRSFNMKMPEEINRILTDRVSTLLFCPTDSAIQNLKNENLTSGVHKTGDVMADALFFYKVMAPEKATHFKTPPKGPFALATVHRAENTDDPERLKNIMEGLEEVNSKLPVYLPLHPRTKAKLASLGIKPTFNIIDPVGYYDMIQLLANSSLVLTDSGGLQKEAYLCDKPCVTLRDETEWVELVESGVNKLVGSDKNAIVNSSFDFTSTKVSFPKFLYGDGKSSAQIADIILKLK